MKLYFSREIATGSEGKGKTSTSGLYFLYVYSLFIYKEGISMRNLDTIVILNSGVDEQKFAESVFRIRKNTQDRLLWFVPKKGIAYDNEINYAMRAKKDILELNWRDTTPTRLPYFMLHPPGYDEWLENPEYRLSEESKPENAVLLVDDFVSGGQTMYKTQCELIKLGYQKDSIFSYAHTLDFNDKYQLLDAQNKEITLQQLLEILKQ